MRQLELGFYSREEIGEALNVNIRDSNHFAERVKAKLDDWGYRYSYLARRGVEILAKPETPEARLAEILYRGLRINVQIEATQFACFITAFTDIDGFSSMPWEERAIVLSDYYGFTVCDKTLRNWTSRLIDCGVMNKSNGSDATRWCTTIQDGIKKRKLVDETAAADMQHYFERRSELYSANCSALAKQGTPPEKAKTQAWKDTYSQLWSEYHCCYYKCKAFMLSAFAHNDVDVWEIYELAREIAAAAPSQHPAA